MDSFDEENPENLFATIKDVLGEDRSGFDFEAMIGDIEGYITRLLKSDISLDTITSLFSTGDSKDVKDDKEKARRDRIRTPAVCKRYRKVARAHARRYRDT